MVCLKEAMVPTVTVENWIYVNGVTIVFNINVANEVENMELEKNIVVQYFC